MARTLSNLIPRTTNEGYRKAQENCNQKEKN